MLRTALPNTR